MDTTAGDDQFRRCWRRQDCGSCLREDGCGWCPFTQACVPNTDAIPLLAPAYDQNICPHWSERWEIRTRPLGCQVSTITSLTAIVSIVSSLVAAALVVRTVLAVQKVQRIRRENPDWWAQCKGRWRPSRWLPWMPSAGTATRQRSEQQPLLGT